MKKKRYSTSVLIEEKLWKEFRKKCVELDVNVENHLADLVKEDLNGRA